MNRDAGLHRPSRRRFLGGLAGVFGALAAGDARAMEGSNRVAIPVIDVGGDSSGRVRAPARLAWEAAKRTSIECVVEPVVVSLDSDALFDHTAAYWWGTGDFGPLGDERAARLRRWLQYGGFLIVDGDATADRGFDQRIRAELARMFPAAPLKRLDGDHTVFKSFYLLRDAPGRTLHAPSLEGVEQDRRTMVVYSRNDMGGAWLRDEFGTWTYSCTPGGERQRETAFRLGVNLLMYALCTTYKSDQVHIPFIMKRRK